MNLDHRYRLPISIGKAAIVFTLLLLAACSTSEERSAEELALEQVETLYNRGRTAMDKGNYARAIEYFQALEANYPFGTYTEQAKLDLLFALDKIGRMEEAVSAADNFIKLYPTHPNVDYAYYMKGVATFTKKQSSLDKFVRGGSVAVRDPQPLRDSQAAFQELLRRYPQSVYAEDTKQRLVYIDTALAARELEIAQFYFDSGAFVAAINRCKQIIFAYETTPTVEGALRLMEKTYVKMGLNDLADSTRDVLVTNFPENAEDTPESQKKRRGIFRRLFGREG